jgi:hypothetical protein
VITNKTFEVFEDGCITISNDILTVHIRELSENERIDKETFDPLDQLVSSVRLQVILDSISERH